MTLRIPKITLAVLLIPLVATAANANAGQYHVFSCRTPDGRSAPVDGWVGSTANGSAFDDYTKDTCSEKGALVAALGEQTTHLSGIDQGTWTFAVPSNVAITGATLYRAGKLHGAPNENATYQFWLSGPTPTKVFDECIYTLQCVGRGDLAEPLSMSNRLVVPPANLGAHLYVNVSCSAGFREVECKNGYGDPNGYAAAVYVFAADLTLEQTAGPSATSVGGDLASAPVVSGTTDVTFSASDPGTGVYSAVFSVDGQVVQATVLNENGGRCRNVGQTTDGLPAFLYVQPCLGSVSADVGLDTTKLSDGSHHLVVSVTDAAGNAAPVLDRTFTVANRPPMSGPAPAPGASGASGPGGATMSGSGANAANGVNASSPASLSAHWEGTRSARLTSVYGRAHTITGRLTTAGGVPIAGAQLDLVATPAYAGAQPVTMSSPRTAIDGSFSVRLPRGVSSRTMRLAYRSRLGDVLPAATCALTLSVRASIALSITPHAARVGRTVFFSGRLLGGPIPQGGKQLVLEARSHGSSWLEFKVVRADARGRYHASYRFRFPGPVRYRFRVLSEQEADYPFGTGTSNVVGVWER
jgi:hypothetical protein